MSFYAADGGVEKVLYYDRKVIPYGAKRGLCAMLLPYDPVSSPDVCLTELDSPGLDNSLYCNDSSMAGGDPTGDPDGCYPDIVNICTIAFDTTNFDNNTDNPDNGKSYHISVTVFPYTDPNAAQIPASNNNIARNFFWGQAEKLIFSVQRLPSKML